MDFALNEEQQAVADLARQILVDRVDSTRLTKIEEQGEWFDRGTYTELANAGLLGVGLAEDVGGGGRGLVEVAQLLEAQGESVAPLPLLPTGLAAMAIDRFGDDSLRRRWLPGVIDGSTVLSVALQEYLDDDLLAPTTRAEPDGEGWRLDGTKVCVEFAEQAERTLVGASTPDGPAVFLVDPAADGVTLTPGVSTRDEPVHEMALSAALADGMLGHPSADAETLRWIVDRAVALVCATQVGVVEAALRMTAEYTSEREQFGRKIATFQAVTQREADAYIGVAAIRLCTYQAVWRLSEGLPSEEELAVAKWYASDAAQQVAHAAQHLHGGIGVDVDYPLYRYTLWNKHLETSLGAGTAQLRKLGALLAG